MADCPDGIEFTLLPEIVYYRGAASFCGQSGAGRTVWRFQAEILLNGQETQQLSVQDAEVEL